MTIKIFLFTAALAAASFNAAAQVENGSFETWSNGAPSDWTTIDSGILLDRVSTPIVDGQYALKATVTTATQSNTDLLQQFDVVANQTYDFEVSIYHTEGSVAARIIADGYRGYSDPSIRNQWQQLRYSYQATSTKTINLGLRFYDRSGFDGSEVVYVDSFQPTSTTTPPPPPPPVGCQDVATTITINTDDYGNETSWQLSTAAGQTIGGGSNYASNQSYVSDFCLSEGDYIFAIADTFGDGICCGQGNGSYVVEANGQELLRGGQFSSNETRSFTIQASGTNPPPDTGDYYQAANGLSGFALKTALHNIIKGHAAQGYGALWGFYSANSLDLYFENDGSILDIYSENPNGADPYNYTAITNQCGSYNSEADCYNREHSFPRSWFGGSIEPMNSDVHFIFATDGQVNAYRGSFPYGEVGTNDVVSNNGSRRGSAQSGLGYSGTVFEPIDEFKGDVARSTLYVATRYENIVAGWENNSSSSNAILDGSNTQVFETWYINLLKQWHQQDPVSQKEIDRNNAAHVYQGNRNPFVDQPNYVQSIWGN
ncbi:MAG: endonuclease [Arenicella sp.]|nr:endonuclease [Arenicella sp.]